MMTSLVGFLSLLSALTATSSALWCTECASTTSSTCKGNRTACPSGYLCGSTYQRYFTELPDGLKDKFKETGAWLGHEDRVNARVWTESLIRGCNPSSACNFDGTMSIKRGHIGLSISCCDTDGCTPTLPTFPRKSPDPNGVICQSCVSAQSVWCDTLDTIQCTGNENMCVLLTTEITGSASNAIQGCATKSYCNLGSLSDTTAGSTTKVTYTCTRAGISGGTSDKVFLTPIIMCLLLLKLFL